jgi:hypothetical protein
MTRPGRRRPRSGEEGITGALTGRELAVLVNGAWAPRWYWRNELKAMQDPSRRMGYPAAHSSAVLRSYQPTDEFRPHPTEPGTSGRVWLYRTPARPTHPDHAQADAPRGHAVRRHPPADLGAGPRPQRGHPSRYVELTAVACIAAGIRTGALPISPCRNRAAALAQPLRPSPPAHRLPADVAYRVWPAPPRSTGAIDDG